MKVALHACCGPCASACVPVLKGGGDEVVMVFANSNIDTREEFERRREAAARLAEVEGVRFVALDYDHEDWLKSVAAGFEAEPEKGARCARCFRYSLARTARAAAACGCAAFTSSLTVSPHKVSAQVFAAGEEVAAGGDLRFLPHDFKRRDGFLKSLRRSAELGLYRQNYCGCEFSRATRAPDAASSSGRVSNQVT